MTNSSKEIATAIVNEDHPPMDNEEAIVAYSKWIDQHTNQTLDELKEKVDGEQYDSGWGSEDTEYYRGYNDAIKEIITLIDEAINE